MWVLTLNILKLQIEELNSYSVDFYFTFTFINKLYLDNMEDPRYQSLQTKICRADFHGAIIR